MSPSGMIGRRVACGAIVALLAGCSASKPVHILTFEVAREARNLLAPALRDFAARNELKLEDPMSEQDGWPLFWIGNDDLSITIGPELPETNPGPTMIAGPLTYVARFYDHTEARAQDPSEIYVAFGATITAIPGVRKLPAPEPTQ